MVRIVERRGEVCIMYLLYARPRKIVNKILDNANYCILPSIAHGLMEEALLF